jgi:CheY-like chemotaxis protein
MYDMQPRPSAPRSVLVVDDDDGYRKALTQILDGQGYPVAAAANGEAALDYLESHELPGVILLDLMMPGMNGWVFRLEQRKNPRLASVPVILFSGVYDTGPAANFLSADDHLQKPVEMSLLLEKVRRFCGH